MRFFQALLPEAELNNEPQRRREHRGRGREKDSFSFVYSAMLMWWTTRGECRIFTETTQKVSSRTMQK
jgi:hypothetical protein